MKKLICRFVILIKNYPLKEWQRAEIYREMYFTLLLDRVPDISLHDLALLVYKKYEGAMTLGYIKITANQIWIYLPELYLAKPKNIKCCDYFYSNPATSESGATLEDIIDKLDY